MPREGSAVDSDKKLPHKHDSFSNGEVRQDYCKSSLQALYIGAFSKVAATPLPKSAGNLKEAHEVTLPNDDWYEIRWDDSVEAIELTARVSAMAVLTRIPTTNGARTGTAEAVDGTVGRWIKADETLTIKVGSNPNGCIFVCGHDAAGAAVDTTVVDYVAHGDDNLSGIELGTT